ncbi:hypothetical protein AC249_AIPGENE949 [Exaiptasia diaphana]|nr:hypothetical protein AC249_AIPGENE949 [Exaiptasia diaphana]
MVSQSNANVLEPANTFITEKTVIVSTGTTPRNTPLAEISGTTGMPIIKQQLSLTGLSNDTNKTTFGEHPLFVRFLKALTTAQRCQTIASLDIELMQVMPDRIRFTLKDKLKTTRPGSHLEPIEVTAFPQEPCPVRHIEQYITRTQNHRQSSKLLVSFIKP